MARLKACGGMEVCLHAFLVLSLDGSEWSCSRLVTYTSLIGDKWWAAEPVETLRRTCRESNHDSSAVQPAHTDCAIPAALLTF